MSKNKMTLIYCVIEKMVGERTDVPRTLNTETTLKFIAILQLNDEDSKVVHYKFKF
jgi:hypothetical protein